ncbi:MAG: dTDP-4-amino-4,6-dideoxygalactose transaminase [Oscillospiraceae bacterium]|nr:dTDP-4-amino-4,6-dideoxygalactose transaminase [Oscillospiraceae bacterium]
MSKIPFNIPPYLGPEMEYVKQAAELHKICGDGTFTKRANAHMEQLTGAKKALLTTSCTHALEMAALLADIKPGDEVIMPSYTFVSTANAFALRGAKIVFVDVRPDTMNIDENCIEDAITERTKAIAVVHYAGVACEMDTIMDIAKRHNLLVIEDAAQALFSTYNGKPCGTIGEMGCFSYHETKNISMGEGGCLTLRDDEYVLQAEIIREKGTDRTRFFRGEIDKYQWQEIGSSYLPSELNAAYVLAQLEHSDIIQASRMAAWELYDAMLRPLRDKKLIETPFIPEECVHNAHMYWIKAKDLEERTALINHLKAKGIGSVFHYVPLHSSAAGLRYSRFHGEDRYTTKESERLTRLPLFYGITAEQVVEVVKAVFEFYGVEHE